ncbi:MAG: biotin-dependent carboxyltransferase family protein [Hydrogenophilus sp.]|nr:biotin-dependent carboxyltransferase family protein [Hydrogenophilus sp.]
MALSPQPTLLLLTGGRDTTVQDLGRPHHRHLGVALSGALDPFRAAALNLLVGSPPEAALLELGPMGLTLAATTAPARLALSDGARGWIERTDGEEEPLPPWRTVTLGVGDRLRVNVSALSYLAVEGGIDLPPVLGSRSTHTRTGTGGLSGRPLAPGDHLPIFSATPGPERVAPPPFPSDPSPIRLLLGPQQDHFLPEALTALLTASWTLTATRDRMGIRLSGPPLPHRTRAHAEILSEPVVPGAIQVPPDQQPILLLADAQTIGGYPKIAVVIAADLGRIAALPSGSSITFMAVPLDAAHAALRERHQQLHRWRQSIRPLSTPPADALLCSHNLISGVINPLTFEEESR